ncbi:hypothetical protein [Paenibacillus crassostreae]|uniref:Uncharacterized protein n=1 Tax=Paenibacillus crassostreae TaxID=1763538 RepID=A0A167C6G1_9BACL|nr:hypothetical protein [Paenibacillus crassostreae]AOZ91588.1 hypothetical protein LPB68_04735 [Paenibacillus crassostreae]OAB72838.1 hypothetical protein PNBC_15515 [Paenibacillus crassostreae]
MSVEAINKLNGEIAASNNPYVQAVGSFLLQHINSNPQDAEKIMATDKTIIKSLDEMRKVAEKKKVGNCAVLSDQEGFAVVLNYFGIERASIASVASPSGVPVLVSPQAAQVVKTVSFDVNLDDLLGGL